MKGSDNIHGDHAEPAVPADHTDRTDQAELRDAFHSLLHTARVWDTELPAFDPSVAPDDPLSLFQRWFIEAVAAGQPEPHTMTLATVDGQDRADLRTLILHDADPAGWHFASHATSRKGRQLTAHPGAALGFYWATQGRAVRIRGDVVAADAERSSADLHVRSTGALAAALVGRQSDVLASTAELAEASRAAWELAQRRPDTEVPSWTAYTLVPDEVEFFQGEAARRHIRLRYRLDAGQWVRELLWP